MDRRTHSIREIFRDIILVATLASTMSIFYYIGCWKSAVEIFMSNQEKINLTIIKRCDASDVRNLMLEYEIVSHTKKPIRPEK